MILKEEFKLYESIRNLGHINMFDVKGVAERSGLTKDKIFEIMKNYETLEKEFRGDDSHSKLV